MSVVFCDMVGSTARAESLDPEDVEAILAPYHRHVREELERFGGTVEKFIGDAVMAVFGAPVAHEDDPERAVRAALSIRDWAREQGDFELRIGVNTGEALVSLGAHAEQGESLVKGDVVNTAARLETAAATNSVFVGDATYRATYERIDYAARDNVHAKGKSAPVPVWEALRPSASGGELRPSVPFIGREWELDLLTSAFLRVRSEGTPQLVTLVGVPGIGKSRLLSEFQKQIASAPMPSRWRQGRSLAYGDGVSLWALGEIVKAEAGIFESDSADDAGAKLGVRLAEMAPDRDEARWLDTHLRPLIGLATSTSPSTATERSPAWRRFLELLTEDGPFVLVLEDLHWADDALLTFVDELIDGAGDVPMLVVATARPELLERRPDWGGGKLNAATVSLSPLSDEATARIVASVLERSVATADEHDLLTRIGGNPLYAEQYARATVERGVMPGLPDTVQGIIAARLDGLSHDEKSLLHDAAVVGNVFWVGAIEAIGIPPGSELSDLLRGLERKQFVQRARQSSVAGEAEYAFRHVLLRDVAYGQIPRTRRAEKHRRAAEWLESLGRADDHADMLADHYLAALRYARAAGEADAGLAERAVSALRDAGDRAVSLAAYGAAVHFYEAALELSPDDPHLLLRLGRTRFSAESGGVPELEAAYNAFRASGDPESAAEAALALRMIAWYQADGERVQRWLDEATALVDDRPDSRAKALALVTRAGMYQGNGDYHEAVRIGREALAVVDRLGLDDLRPQMMLRLGTSRASLGEREGLDDLQRAVALATTSGDVALVHGALNNLSGMQFSFGRVDDAVQTYENLSGLVERFGRDTDRRWAREELAGLRAAQGRWDEALALLDGFIAEVEAGFPHYLEPGARVTRAGIRLARDDVRGALDDTKRAVEVARIAGDSVALVPALIARATCLAATDQRTEATDIVDEALRFPQALATLNIDLVGLAWLARDLGREHEVGTALQGSPSFPWVVAARSIASGDFDGASAVLAALNCPPTQAYAALRLAEDLFRSGRVAAAEPHLQRALGFYRSVDAVRFVTEAEALRAPARQRLG